MVFFSGLRGAVAYACANIFPDERGNRDVIITTTMVIALATILLKGGFTVRMLQILNIPTGVDAQPFADKVSGENSLLLLVVTCHCYFFSWPDDNS